MEEERFGDLWYFVCDSTKALGFGWSPETSPEEGLPKLVDWIKDNKELFDGYLLQLKELTDEYKSLTKELNNKGVNDLVGVHSTPAAPYPHLVRTVSSAGDHRPATDTKTTEHVDAGLDCGAANRCNTAILSHVQRDLSRIAGNGQRVGYSELCNPTVSFGMACTTSECDVNPVSQQLRLPWSNRDSANESVAVISRVGTNQHHLAFSPHKSVGAS